MNFTFLNIFYIFWNVFYIFYVGEVCLDRSPSPGLQARTGWDTSPALLAMLLYKFYFNQAVLSGATVVAGCWAGFI